MEPTESFEWQGRTIAYGRAGDGPPVVFCHGTPFSSRVWSRYADALAADYTVHLWDMPGYGRSSKHAEHAVDFGAQAQAFAALLEHWGLERPHVIAHDFGGAVSLQTVVNHGREYGSLLLADAVAIPPIGSPFFRFVGEHAGVLDGLPDYVHEAIVRAYIRGASHRPLAQPDLDELVGPWLDSEGKPAFYRQMEHFDEAHLRDNELNLARLTMPTHVVWGEDDAWIPLKQGRRLADLMPDTTITTVPEAGHLVHYDAPVALIAVLTRWLDRVT